MIFLNCFREKESPANLSRLRHCRLQSRCGQFVTDWKYDSPGSVRTMGSSAGRARIPFFCQPRQSAANHASANRNRTGPAETGAASGDLPQNAPPSRTALRWRASGSEIVTSFRVVPFLPFRAQWIALITEFEWNHHFADVQKQGPFKSFHHRHELREETRDQVRGTVVRDVIEYDVGFGWLGELAQRLFVSRQIAANFRISSEGAREVAGNYSL